MTKQFLRKLKVHLSNLRTGEAIEYNEQFKITFSYDRNNNIKTPDIAEVNIHNIKNEFFSNIVNPSDIFMELTGGYGDYTGRLFTGTLNEIRVGRVGLDVVVTLIVGDGLAGKETTSERQYKKKTAYSKIVEDLLTDLKNAGVEISAGMKDYAKSLLTGDKIKTGKTFSESTAKALDDILEPKGLVANIANNELTIRERQTALNRPAVILAWDTGLIEVKRNIVEIKVAKKVYKNVIGVQFSCLIDPNLIPGQQIKMESEFISGYFTVYKISAKGDCRGGQSIMTGEAHE